MTPAACGNSVFRTLARILVPVNDMNPMAFADSGASHVNLPQSALFDSKSAKPVNLRLAAGEIQAVEAHREIFAEHVTTPLCPLGRVFFSETSTYSDLDTSDFDSQLRQQIRNSSGLDAVSN